MKKKVAIIHTSFVSVNDLKALFTKIIPEVQVINIVDDSLLQEVMSNGSITPGIVKRICTYAHQAQEQGADLIFNQCSSVSEAIDVAGKMLKIPCLKVDQAMADKAVEIGKKIAVVATVASTMGPSTRLIARAAEKANKQVIITECLVDGAMDILIREGNVEKHNKMVLQEIDKIADLYDVIVLAQGSMTVLLPHLGHIKTPILTSPQLGVERVKEVLGL